MSIISMVRLYSNQQGNHASVHRSTEESLKKRVPFI